MVHDKFSPEKIIVHHSASATKQDQFLGIDEYHRVKFGLKSSLGYYGAYHYLIEKTGKVMQYRLPNEVGTHTRGQNHFAIGICLSGNFDFQKPTANQVVSLCKLIDYLLKVYKISGNELYPHRYFNITVCPGLLLADDWVKVQYRDYLTENLKHLLLLLKAYLEKAINTILYGRNSNGK